MSEPIRPKVTISDVARACGVSPATVSLVLRDQPGIGEETRQKAIESHFYSLTRLSILIANQIVLDIEAAVGAAS